MSLIGTTLILMAASPMALPLHISMQATIEHRIIIRIPTRPTQRPRRRAPSGIVWRERPIDDCQPVSQISRARFTRPGVVDLLMQDSSLVRARLSSECVALGYYSAFYLVPGDDGRICASRDAIVSRAGDECAISGFHRLEPRQSD